jgi:hypothetical protein
VSARIATVADLVIELERLDPSLPVRIVDPREHAQYVTAVTEVAGDPDTGWSRGAWLIVSGGVEPGRHPYAPRAAFARRGRLTVAVTPRVPCAEASALESRPGRHYDTARTRRVRDLCQVSVHVSLFHYDRYIHGLMLFARTTRCILRA